MGRAHRPYQAIAVAIAVVVLAIMGVGPAHAAEIPPPFVSTWGSEGTDPGQFDLPFGVAMSADGTVYVADRFNHRVEYFDATGAFLGQWGSDGSDPGDLAQPIGIAVDDGGDVLVTDFTNNRVTRFTSTGTYLDHWGASGSGNGQFSGPYGVDTDDEGNVYVADYLNHRVQKFDSTGAFVTKWGTDGSGNGQFSFPAGIAVESSGNVLVVESGGARVQRFTNGGGFLSTWGSEGSSDGQFSSPQDLTTDADGNVYVADGDNHRVQAFTSSGSFLDSWGTSGTGDGQFNWATGIAVSPLTGHVYVVDQFNHRVQHFGDAVDPLVTLTTPADGAAYPLGAAVAADYTCSDENSGVASCDGTVADGASMDTTTLGDHDFTVTAEDEAGNTAEVTHSYTVANGRPDGRVRVGVTGTEKGDGVYNLTAAGQTAKATVPARATATYFLTVQNDAPFNEALRLRGTASTANYQVNYTRSGIDITTPVTLGSYTTPELGPGETFLVKVQVKVKAGAAVGSSLAGLVTTRSTTHPPQKDVIGFTTRRA